MLSEFRAMADSDKVENNVNCNILPANSTINGDLHVLREEDKSSDALLGNLKFESDSESAKGLEICNPTAETKNELSSTNVIQMFGRENKIPPGDETEKIKLHPKEPVDEFPTNKKRSRKAHKYIRPVEEMEEDTICGLGSYRPEWLQKWATSRSYLILFSIAGVLQGAYYTYFIGILSTLEKRYAFTSKISGTIMMIDEIIPLLLGILVGYFGGRTHRPRMVFIGMFLSVLCCFISALPYFMYGSATHLVSHTVFNGTKSEYCNPQVQQDECMEDDRPPTISAVVCFLFGSFLKGFGTLSYCAIGISYMDDNAKKKNTPIYLAVAISLRLLGPTVGYFMSSAFLVYYENPLVDPGFGPEDPRWIGAWWVGFVLQGILLLITSFPILLFPRRLPSQRQNFSNPDNENLSQMFAGLLKALKRLIKNPLYLCFCMGDILSIDGGFGHFIMLPKYMESQFRLSASEASLFSGPPGLIAIQIFSIVGGLVVWKFQPQIKKLVISIGITEIIGSIGFLILMIPFCQSIMLRGTTINTDGLIDLQNECNKGCNCTESVFNPVCGPDGQSTYFSPCHAGCLDVIKDSTGVEKYVNCSCVHNSMGDFTTSDSVTKGYCPVEGCWSQAVAYIATLPVLQAITSTTRIAHTMILLRSVDPEDKSIALGAFETLICIFAVIPFPLLYGAMVDSVCLIWETSCGQTGNCWFYDIEKFRYFLHGMSALCTGSSVIFYILVFFLSHRMKDLYSDDEPVKESTKEPIQKKNSGQEAISKL